MLYMAPQAAQALYTINVTLCFWGNAQKLL